MRIKENYPEMRDYSYSTCKFSSPSLFSEGNTESSNINSSIRNYYQTRNSLRNIIVFEDGVDEHNVLRYFEINRTDFDGSTIHKESIHFGYRMEDVYALGQIILKKSELTEVEKEAILLVFKNMAFDLENERLFVT